MLVRLVGSVLQLLLDMRVKDCKTIHRDGRMRPSWLLLKIWAMVQFGCIVQLNCNCFFVRTKLPSISRLVFAYVLYSILYLAKCILQFPQKITMWFSIKTERMKQNICTHFCCKNLNLSRIKPRIFKKRWLIQGMNLFHKRMWIQKRRSIEQVVTSCTVELD